MNLLSPALEPTSIPKLLRRLSEPSHARNYLRVRVLTLILFLHALPVSALAQSGSVLVSFGSNTIREFSLTGEDLGIFASTGLSGPLGLALDRFGNVYVANVGNGTIRKFSPTGEDLGIFASAGLHEPIGLAFDAAGNLFVSDIFDNTIHKFSSAGQDLGTIASLLGFGCPTGLVVNRSGTLLVADQCSSVIRQFSLTGQGLGIFASTGLSNPQGLAFDTAGDLLVSNTDNGGPFRNTIRKFSPTGEDLGTFASTGLRFPAGIAVDRAGNVLVANEEQRPGQIDYSILSFSLTGEDRGDFVVISDQPRFLVIVGPSFAGTPGTASCHGKSVSALTHQFGSVHAAASALGFTSVRALQRAIQIFCDK